jgi:hypothetical protein
MMTMTIVDRMMIGTVGYLQYGTAQHSTAQYIVLRYFQAMVRYHSCRDNKRFRIDDTWRHVELTLRCYCSWFTIQHSTAQQSLDSVRIM